MYELSIGESIRHVKCSPLMFIGRLIIVLGFVVFGVLVDCKGIKGLVCFIGGVILSRWVIESACVSKYSFILSCRQLSSGSSGNSDPPISSRAFISALAISKPFSS